VRCTAQRSGTSKTKEGQDVSGELISNVASFALKQRLAKYDEVHTSVECSFQELLQGQVESVQIRGRCWSSPLDLTCRDLDFRVGQVKIDTAALMRQRAVVLQTPPTGIADVTLSSRDFGNFCNHPMMRKPCSRAVKSMRFQFGPPEEVEIRDGAVYFTGTWPALKTTYDIVMKPLNVGEGMENLEITTTSRSSATLPSNLPRNHEQVCAAELAKFFKGLLLDLEGAELRYQSMQIVPGSSSEANNSPTEEWLKLRLNLRVRQFPPLNIQF